MIYQFCHGRQPWHGALVEAIMAERSATPQSRLGVSSGACWSGRKGIEMPPELDAMLRWALYEVSGTDVWKLSAWANIAIEGGATGEHDHANPANVWSGCYYLSGGAEIVFPRLALALAPEPGLLLAWPAQERHYVREQGAGYPRVSVAFNASPEPF